MDANLPYLIAISMTDGIGPVTARNLIAFCGGPHEVFKARKGKLAKVPGVGPKTIATLQSAVPMERAEAELAFCQQKGIDVLPYYSKAYPRPLSQLFDAPLILFKKGALEFDQQPSIAIVGTRKPSEYGRELSRKFAAWFASRGVNVVSGLAYGIDIEAHKAALDAGGRTTAILGHGLDRIYPSKHAARAGQIPEKGALITEFVTGTNPDAGNFPARNRIIAGMSKGVIVIEATATGGALITAKMAFEQNREVFAIPGDVHRETSKGCNRLIRDNIARLVTSPEEIAEELNLEWVESAGEAPTPAAKIAHPLSNAERKILTHLEKGESPVDEIGVATDLGAGTLNALLLGLEFKGLVRQLPGKRFKRI